MVKVVLKGVPLWNPFFYFRSLLYRTCPPMLERPLGILPFLCRLFFPFFIFVFFSYCFRHSVFTLIFLGHTTRLLAHLTCRLLFSKITPLSKCSFTFEHFFLDWYVSAKQNHFDFCALVSFLTWRSQRQFWRNVSQKNWITAVVLGNTLSS